MSQPFRLILGIATFCICIWIRFDLDFWEWVIEINWYTYWYCTYFIMITMLFVVINSLIGAYAIIYVSTKFRVKQVRWNNTVGGLCRPTPVWMMPIQQELQNWTGGAFNIIKLMGMKISFPKIWEESKKNKNIWKFEEFWKFEEKKKS